jgi:hypothetical protein
LTDGNDKKSYIAGQVFICQWLMFDAEHNFATNMLPKSPFGECSADDSKELNKRAGIFEK